MFQEIWQDATIIQKAIMMAWAFGAFTVAVMASNKGYDFAVFLFFGLTLSPVLPLIVYAFLEPKEGSQMQQWQAKEESQRFVSQGKEGVQFTSTAESNIKKVNCIKCGCEILETTAQKYNGKCESCHVTQHERAT